ncbi:MAG TPA: aldo/keto reductase [Gemmatimonadales bacterium]
MINRRNFVGIAAGAGASLALPPQLLRALQRPGAFAPSSAELIMRTIPSSGQKIPAVGLAFSNHPSCADHAALKEVMKAFADGGGKMLDATLGNAANEQFHFTAASELGITKNLFWSTRGFVHGPPDPSRTGAAAVKPHIDAVLEKLKVPRIDLAWTNAASDPALLAALKEEKKAGRIRHIGVMTIVVKNQAAQLEALMRNEPIDFIGIDYDVSHRFAEETILPLALERKIGVVAYFPFSNNSGVSCTQLSRNLFARVGSTPLPEWAADFDAKTWSHFFLKYVLSHPAITVARVGTTKPHHMLDNIGGGIGRLPDEATRKRMAAVVDALPALPPLPQNPAAAPGIAVATAVLDRYVGEYAAASGFIATFRRDGDKLFVKPGNNPEAPLNARSEIRFQDPRGPIFEFQVDAQGKVTGAILEQQGPQGAQRMPLERK